MLKTLGLTFAGATLAAWPAPLVTPRLVWNASASAPVGLYLITPACSYPVGTLVLLEPPGWLAADLAQRQALPSGVPLLKRIAAGPGQTVCRRGAVILIDGAPRARVRLRDRGGRTLPRWTGCRQLGAGTFFFLNDSPLSLDSRYFGPLPARAVRGTARSLWTWSPAP